MSLMKNLIHGTDFDADSLNALQKVTLRAVVMSFLFYGLVAIEGMIMRMVSTGPVNPLPEMFNHPAHYFSIMTAHPIVGIYLSTGLCGLYVPGTVPDQKTALQHQAG